MDAGSTDAIWPQQRAYRAFSVRATMVCRFVFAGVAHAALHACCGNAARLERLNGRARHGRAAAGTLRARVRPRPQATEGRLRSLQATMGRQAEGSHCLVHSCPERAAAANTIVQA